MEVGLGGSGTMWKWDKVEVELGGSGTRWKWD